MRITSFPYCAKYKIASLCPEYHVVQGFVRNDYFNKPLAMVAGLAL